MKVTVCELSHEPHQLEAAWLGLCGHVSKERSDVVVLPEMAFCRPFWLIEKFDSGLWSEAGAVHDQWLDRLRELGASFVVGTRPVTSGSSHFNEGFVWSQASGYSRLRRKFFLPNEPDGWEGNWLTRGDPEFPCFSAGALRFGLNICTELWALETYRAYAAGEAHAVIAPRATAAATTEKWLAVGKVAAVVSGTYCVSSNQIDKNGACGGVGWIIDPDGSVLARTSADQPFCTADISVARALEARRTYPRYVFGGA